MVPNKKRERQRRNKLLGQPVRIVVCAYPSTTITSAVDLVKSAVLYGDEVVLYSPVGSFLGHLSALTEGDGDQLADFMVSVGPVTDAKFGAQLADLDATHGPGTARRLMVGLSNPNSLLRTTMRKQAGTEGLDLDEFDDSFTTSRQRIEDLAQTELRNAGFEQVSAAFDAGILKVAALGAGEDLYESFTRQLDEVLTDASVYPLFDDELGQFVKTLAKGGKLNQTTYNRAHGAQAATADRMLAQLPTFPLASMDEIIGIRDRLKDPLIRFRSEIIEVTTKLQLDALNDDFEEASVELWHSHVAPRLLELDEIVHDEGLLRSYGLQAAGELVVPGALAGVGALAGNFTVGAIAGVAAGTISTVAGAGARRREQKRRKHMNPYFFLHTTEQHLARSGCRWHESSWPPGERKVPDRRRRPWGQ